jgi:hypothetical protein
MGVRRHQYAKELEKGIREKGTLKEAHEQAVKRSSVKPEVKTRTGKKYAGAKKLLAKTKRRLYELWHGEKAYLPGHKKPKYQQKKK